MFLGGVPLGAAPLSSRRATGRRHPPGGAWRRGFWTRAFLRRLFDWRRVFHRERSWRRVWVWRAPQVANSIPTETLTKTPAEERYFAFDFSKAPEVVAGETLSSPAIRGGTGLTVGSPSVLGSAFDGIPSGKGVRVLISAGSDDATVALSCTVVTSGGATLEVGGRLAIAEPNE